MPTLSHVYAVQTEAGMVSLRLYSATHASVSQPGSIAGKLNLVCQGWIPERFSVQLPGTGEPVLSLTRSIVMKAVLVALDEWAVKNRDKLALAEIDSCALRLSLLGREQHESRSRLLARKAKFVSSVWAWKN